MIILAGPAGIALCCLIYLFSQNIRHNVMMARAERARMYARAAAEYSKINSEIVPLEKRFEWVITRMQGDYPKVKYEFLTALVYAVLWEVDR